MSRLSKRAMAILALALLASCMVSCSDMNYYRGYKGNYAYVKLPNGTVVEGANVTYDYRAKNDFMIVTFEDGTEYFTHASNVCIVSSRDEEE